ncbi:Prophage CP4-57 regulatory [Shewanella denitrificans OS217]|jgi:predicted DNA-binding transcriptional regulator AlpA|uniref:Prophage CP4-57 regulatory n=1 Tax=Shewanella denitrificans (strain OS217 / ATCC BAA-1090 / DSM 15013) TaxID=318161 RepID=Q12SG6_SHEDO|nr:AlpA family phage regulatory protein [Shewanella denitrificans]ABE53610.1 Prophage CP4-57 regulatory [Shewanella denitrificans OS217]
MTIQYTRPTPEQRQELLKVAGESDRLVRENERKQITTLSRSRTWELERLGLHPIRTKLGVNSVAWLLSDLLWFIYHPTLTQAVSSPRTTSKAQLGAQK